MATKDKSENISLTNAQLKKITEVASQAAIEAYRKEIEVVRQENRDKRLYNTRLLLEKYRGLVKYSEDAIFDAIQLDEDMELQTLIELMGAGKESVSLSVESIQERTGKVRVILNHVTKMLEYYRFRCESSGKPEVVRKWETVYYLYLADNEKTVQELAEAFYVDERTVYRYNRAALQDLSALLFGWIEQG